MPRRNYGALCHYTHSPDRLHRQKSYQPPARENLVITRCEATENHVPNSTVCGYFAANPSSPHTLTIDGICIRRCSYRDFPV